MDKDTRNAIERATQRARRLLEDDLTSQLEGMYDILRSGAVAATGGTHLSARQQLLREKIVASIEHKRAAGLKPPEAVMDCIRDAAFTALNRCVALKMLEARELVQECISKGEQSSGYKEFCGLAPGVRLLADGAGYRLYIESLFDELSTEIKVFFDRRDPASVLWPKRQTFEELLRVLNVPELASVWGEDETLGWVYQYFNSSEERRAMREASQAPRNSRELAIRNQFFTPRYVVQFLTDNTLGRIWYEMLQGETRLVEICEYLVRPPDETCPPREKKDPRDIRVLDPACGSGHFLLYAFDLLLMIYEEAWNDPQRPKSVTTGSAVRDDYPDLNTLRRALPALVLRHNLHGIDIDLRCAQIAQLALWMRTQRAFRDFGIARADRPLIRRANVVIAEPIPGNGALVETFAATLDTPLLGDLFGKIVAEMKLAGELGLLLKIEADVGSCGDQSSRGVRRPRERVGSSLPTGLRARIVEALQRFVGSALDSAGMRCRLFAEDAAQGLGLVELAEKKFDVLLMNPPFGDPTVSSKTPLARTYPKSKGDLYTCFVTAGGEALSDHGLLGVICPRSCMFKSEFAAWRTEIVKAQHALHLVADLGPWVLDQALVETALMVIERSPQERRSTVVLRLLSSQAKECDLRAIARNVSAALDSCFVSGLELFASIPDRPWLFYLPRELLRRFSTRRRLGELFGRPMSGICTGNDFAMVRLWWEPDPRRIGRGAWAWHSKGGEYQPFFENVHLVVDWRFGGANMATAYVRNEASYFAPGVSYPLRTRSSFGPRVLRRGILFSQLSQVCVGGSPEEQLALVGYLVLRAPQVLLEAALGSGDAMSAQGAARSYAAQVVERIPIPEFESDLLADLAQFARDASEHFARAAMRDITSPVFSLRRLFSGAGASFRVIVRQAYCKEIAFAVELLRRWDQLDERVMRSMGMSACEREYMTSEYGPRFGELAPAVADISGVARDMLLPMRELLGEVGSDASRSRLLLTKSFIVHRRLEVVSRRHKVQPGIVAAAVVSEALVPDEVYRSAASDMMQALLGIAFNRHSVSEDEQWREDIAVDPFAELTAIAPLAAPSTGDRVDSPAPHINGMLVDDLGRQGDVVVAIDQAVKALCVKMALSASDLIDAVCRELGAADVRTLMREQLFDLHLSRCSASRRKAPLYWQLSTPSASYSVWLYIRVFDRDTLYRVQNDYVVPKLAHEERKLENMRAEYGTSPKAGERKQLAAQESLVEELCAFLEEIRRVALLWNPNLDDGVIINFAPLWRLVPQSKPWQKELKATWDALCAGEYDWAQLSMHLWPERVVP
ncbi:MAG: Eco57I restriction-modification methylase domain-containing protein, partial [Gammaproteobacteria bacterium]